MASPTYFDGGYLDERFTSASFGSDRLPVPNMQHLFGRSSPTSADTSGTSIDTPDDSTSEATTEVCDTVASEQSSTRSSTHYPTPLHLDDQVQRLQTHLHDLEDRHNSYIRYNQTDKDNASNAMYSMYQQLTRLEHQMSNLHLEARLDALAGVDLGRIEAQEQHTSLVFDSLQRQINTLQCEFADIKARHKQTDRNQSASTSMTSEDLAFLRTCLLDDNLSHADRFAALEIVARMQPQTPSWAPDIKTPVPRRGRLDSVFNVVLTPESS